MLACVKPFALQWGRRQPSFPFCIYIFCLLNCFQIIFCMLPSASQWGRRQSAAAFFSDENTKELLQDYISLEGGDFLEDYISVEGYIWYLEDYISYQSVSWSGGHFLLKLNCRLLFCFFCSHGNGRISINMSGPIKEGEKGKDQRVILIRTV